jgi:hypothetical protein
MEDQLKQTENFYELKLWVPARGYRWEKAFLLVQPESGRESFYERKKTLFLVPADDYLGLEDVGTGDERECNPLALQHSALFRVFADVSHTPEAILEFANAWGMLGVSKPASSTQVSPVNAPDVSGETFEDWIGRIAAMRRAVDLYDMVRDGDEVALRRHFKMGVSPGGTEFGGTERWFYDSHPDEPQPNNPSKFFRGLGRRQASVYLDAGVPRKDWLNPAWPARVLLGRLVNDVTGERTASRLCIDPADLRQKFRCVPKDLLGALWVQLARAVDGNLLHRKCKGCGRWFEVSQEAGRRSQSVFCSDACKSLDYRHNREEAARLHGEGLTDQKIAKQLGKSVASVRNWIKASELKGEQPS